MLISAASLRVLAAWSGTFATREPIGRWRGGEAGADGLIQVPWYEYSNVIERFVREMSSAGLVRPVDWMTWMNTPVARRLVADPSAIADATPDDLVYLLTAIIRGERFSDGEIVGAYERGTLLAIADRARALLGESP